MRALLLLLSLGTTALAQGHQGDYTARDFRFTTGETLPEVRIHYTTLGTPRTDAQGVTRNAVMILHGTGGTGRGFLSANFAGQLFGPGQLLDTAKYFVVLPDNLGHGGSSKPSDGMHARFPRYTYDDMVRAQYLLLTDGLKVNHLRLLMGTSMGCMHSWIWLYAHPDFMDGSVPLACAPTPIVGRNRMIRSLIIESLRGDPAYAGGDYTAPLLGMRAAQGYLWLMGSAPLVQHAQAPTRQKADSAVVATVDRGVSRTDANDMIWYFDASRDYDPSMRLGAIRAPILAINSADDFVNPPELENVAPYVARLKGSRFVLLPITPQTRGHGTHSLPAIWGGHLRDYLAGLPER
ncbi:MAG: alpha/beta fold hydrolase [Gemmatimonadetes bacterium]|nr:alpha/beta fold hydrolase [Gemmatimonadota bacterium]